MTSPWPTTKTAYQTHTHSRPSNEIRRRRLRNALTETVKINYNLFCCVLFYVFILMLLPHKCYGFSFLLEILVLQRDAKPKTKKKYPKTKSKQICNACHIIPLVSTMTPVFDGKIAQFTIQTIESNCAAVFRHLFCVSRQYD